MTVILAVVTFLTAARDEGTTALPRRLLFDAYQQAFPRPRVSAPATIVAVDEASLAALGQWPWPRDRVAALVAAVGAQHPAAIGIDILFPEPDQLSPEAAVWAKDAPDVLQAWLKQRPSNDARLGEVLGKNPVAIGIAGLETPPIASDSTGPLTPARTHGPLSLQALRPYASLLRSIPPIDRTAPGHGLLSSDPDPDGIVRRVYLMARTGETLLPSLDVEMLRLAVGADWFSVTGDQNGATAVGVGDVAIPVQRNGSVWVHFGHHNPDRFVSAIDVLAGKADPAMLESKLVLIAVTGLGLVDQPSTPLESRMPGAEVRAQILETVFDGTTLLRPAWAGLLEAAMTLLCGCVLVATVPALRPRYAVAPYVGGFVILTGVGFGAFLGLRLLIDVLTPALANGVVFVGLLVMSLAEADFQRRLYKRDLELQRVREAKLAGELAAARRIQLGSLPDPRSITQTERRIDLAAMLEPAKHVGGDLYDLFKIDDDHLFFMIGDVSGKGIPASMFMALGKALYKSAVLRRRENIAEIMSEANAEIARDNSEMMFITAVAALLDLRDGTLAYCNAGHDLPLLWQPGRDLETLGGDGGPPLCVLEDFSYPSEVRQLTPGSTVILYTDGVTEAMDPRHELYGVPRLRALIENMPAGTTAQNIVTTIAEDVRRHADGAEPSDDITMVVMIWNGPG